jgi:hypothetical protein
VKTQEDFEMWVQFILPAQSDVEGVVIPHETAITARVQSVSSSGTTLEHETVISLDRFFPPVEDESEFIDAYLSKGHNETRLILTCGSTDNPNCYELKVHSVRFFEVLCSEFFAGLLD